MELKNRRFILIDAEATGFDCKKHQMLEMGIFNCDCLIQDVK